MTLITRLLTAILIALLANGVMRYYTTSSKMSKQQQQQQQHTVIIIGGGLAGMTAALEAHRNGALQVYLLDKEKRLGGNSAKASSGINGVLTNAQLSAHSLDTPSSFIHDTLTSGGGACIEPLVEALVNQSKDAIAFLEALGVDLSVLSKCGGHSFARTHRAKAPPAGVAARNIGFEITSKLIES